MEDKSNVNVRTELAMDYGIKFTVALADAVALDDKEGIAGNRGTGTLPIPCGRGRELPLLPMAIPPRGVEALVKGKGNGKGTER